MTARLNVPSAPVRSPLSSFGAWLAVVLAAGALIAPPESGRYVPVRDARGRPKRWQRDAIELRLVSPPPRLGVTADEALRAAQRAARGWACLGVPAIVVTRSEPAQLAAEDGVNVIAFRDDGWCSRANPDDCYDPKQDAITHAYSRVKQESESAAELIETDIEVNARSAYFGSAPAGELVPRLQALLTHEFGHVLGLDHNCSASSLSLARDNRGAERPLCSSGDVQVRQAAMFPGLSERELPVLVPADQELTGVATLYRGAALERVSVPWSRRARTTLLVVLGGSLLLARWRRRRLALTSGEIAT